MPLIKVSRFEELAILLFDLIRVLLFHRFEVLEYIYQFLYAGVVRSQRKPDALLTAVVWSPVDWQLGIYDFLAVGRRSKFDYVLDWEVAVGCKFAACVEPRWSGREGFGIVERSDRC